MGIGLRRHPHLRLVKEDGPDPTALGVGGYMLRVHEVLVVRVPRGGYSQTGLLPIPNRNELSLGVS